MLSSFSVAPVRNRVKSDDLNGDGLQDLILENTSSIVVLTANSSISDTVRFSGIPFVSFSPLTQSEASAALDEFNSSFELIAETRAALGAFEARLETSANNLQVAAENYASAESQIRDTDVAATAAESTRLAIQQQLAASILSQANQQPSVALQLLS